MTVTDAVGLAGRQLVPTSMFDRLVGRVSQDQKVSVEYAERIVDQALAFLGTVAHHQGGRLVPSPRVDAGWHAFLLYSEQYSQFCFSVAGRFLHHVPDDAPGARDTGEDLKAVQERTVAAIEGAGYRVDPELWAYSGSCSNCADEGNCSASGKDGNENQDTRNG